MADTVGGALAWARQIGVDRLDAQVLLAATLGRGRAWLIAHAEAPLDALAQQRFATECERRAAGEPLAYITGRREFYGLDLQVNPAVLVPRPETETLVDWAVELLHGELSQRPPASVIDLGTGSGAIALAVARNCPRADVSASDISARALQVAHDNAVALGLPLHFLAGDWWQAAGQRRFDLALCNPPYIAAGDPHLPALRHEPQAALTPGADGLQALGRVIIGAPVHLQRPGWLLVEHGFDQELAVRSLFQQAGFDRVQCRQDLAGLARVTGGQLG